MIILENSLFLRIEVDGAEIETSQGLIDKVAMTEGNGMLSPAVELVLNDFNGSLQDSRALTDGNSIVVTVGKTLNDIKNVTRQYRLFGMKQHQTSEGPRIKAVGIYDAPGYLQGSVTESFAGTTSDVLRAMAKTCKLTYSGPEEFNGRVLNDSQIWRNVARSRAAFASEIVRHGYIDDHSAMFLALTSLGILKYRNLMDLIETPMSEIKRTFLSNSLDTKDVQGTGSESYLVAQARDRSTAGLTNSWQNYGSTRIEHSLSGTPVEHTLVNVKTKGTFLAINNAISKTIDRARIDYAHFDCGNTNSKYQQALYQNLKMLGLFGEYISVLTYDITDVQLLDPVIYRQANADLAASVKNTDVYLVIGKSVIVTGGRYYAERIELVRMSLTKSGATALKTAVGEPQSDIKPLIPDVVINPTITSAQNLITSSKSLISMSAATNASMSKLLQNIPYMNNSIGATLNSVGQGISAMTASVMNTATVQKATDSMVYPLSVLNTVSTSTAQMMQQADKDLAALASSLSGTAFAPVVKQATLFAPSGIFHTFAANQGTLKQLNDMSSMMLAVNAQAQKTTGTTPQTASDINTHTTALVAATNSANKANASMWNSLIQILTGTTRPATYGDNVSYIQSVQANAYPTSTNPSFQTVPASTLSDSVLKALTKKNNMHAYPWMPDVFPTVPQTAASDVQKVFGQIGSDFNYAQQRNTELMTTSWSA